MPAAAASHDEPSTQPGDSADLVDLHAVVEGWRAEAALEAAVGATLEAALDDVWITLAEAETAAGVSRSTLRAWYRAGNIPSRLVPGPHGVQRMVPRDAVIDRAERSPSLGRRAASPSAESKSAQTAPSGEEEPTMAESMVKLAEMACAQAEARAEAAEARAAAAETRAAEADALLRAALERAAAAEARLGAKS